MNFKKYHVSRNLLNNVLTSREDSGIQLTVNDDKSITINGTLTAGNLKAFTIGTIDAENGKDYTLSGIIGFTTSTLQMLTDSSVAFPSGNRLLCFNGAITRTSYGDETCTVRLYVYSGVTYDNVVIYPMISQSSAPLPYEPYSSEVWHDIPHYTHNTATDTITTPADIYANGTTATVGLKGNMEQSSGVSPTTPIQPSECGDLETEGAHTGQYKIPILSNSTTTPVYLGEVETTRKVKELVLTGQESTWTASGEAADVYYVSLAGDEYKAAAITTVCTHFESVKNSTNYLHLANGEMCLYSGSAGVHTAGFKYPNSSLSDFKTYLQQQYSAGTPVCVWYVLATPTTGIVNEPLRKIGDYADEVSGITIPVTAGANTISVDTQVQPSEVTVNYKGWHPVQSVHEYDSNYTIATMQALTIAQLQTHTISELQGGEWL